MCVLSLSSCLMSPPRQGHVGINNDAFLLQLQPWHPCKSEAKCKDKHRLSWIPACHNILHMGRMKQHLAGHSVWMPRSSPGNDFNSFSSWPLAPHKTRHWELHQCQPRPGCIPSSPQTLASLVVASDSCRPSVKRLFGQSCSDCSE